MKCIIGAASPAAFFGTLGAFEVVELVLFIPFLAWLFTFKDKLLRRILSFGLVTTAVFSLELWWSNVYSAGHSTLLALQQLNGGNANAAQLREFEAAKDSVHVVAFTIIALTAWLCFHSYAQAVLEKVKQRFASTAILALAFSTLMLTGCMKSFDKPEFVEIDTSETGFLIPLEGDSAQQDKFQSEDYLKQRKVATKRVQITHRWSQEGRMYADGRWIPTVRLVKVNRSPITREWTTPQGPTTGQVSRNAMVDRAIWIESGDSVGFSMGFTCTAFIAEDDAAKFLYWYPSGSLTEVMDQEIRARIQQVSGEVAAKYSLDNLRAKKQEIADAVKKDVTNFFTLRGVTITTVGMFGGMTYENPEIQKSIDQTFIAQQLKVVAEAKFEAQKKENERIELEAEGMAEKSRREALGIADAKKTAAGAEAEAIREVSRALAEAQQNPLLFQFKTLEVEKARVEKWDGRYPTYFMGTAGTSPNLMLQVPAPVGVR